jgi:Ca-activated chloride channel family protein
MKFSAQTDRTAVLANRGGQRFVVAQIIAPTASKGVQRPNVDIAFVLDRSGSMAGQKFELARKAIEQAIDHLSPNDSFAVVIYDDQIDIVQRATRATREAKRSAISKLRDVSPRGTTNLGEGWLVGCGQVAEHLSDDRIGRCLLLTDGLANVGITDAGTLAHHARELRSRGVSSSTFGVGADFDEVLLGQMADAGGGAFTFIERPEQIPALIANELGDTLEIVARDVFVDIRVDAEMKVRPIGPYPWEETPDGVRISLPDLVSAHELELPLEVAVPAGPTGQPIALTLSIGDRNGVFDVSTVTLAWTRTDNPHHLDQVETAVQELVAERIAAVAREEAAALNRDGQYHAAAKRIGEAQYRLDNQFEPTKAIRAIVSELSRDAKRLSTDMDAFARKQIHFSATSVARGGTTSGVLRKRSS